MSGVRTFGQASLARLYQTLILGGCLFASACGQSDLYNRFKKAQTEQGAVDRSELLLWKRSPTIDSGDLQVSAKDDLEKIPRSALEFPDLISKSQPVRSTELLAYDSPDSAYAPSLQTWASKRCPVLSTDFQVYEAYYHTRLGMSYAQQIFNPDFSKVYSASAPLKVFASVPGDGDNNALSTGYDPKTFEILFFRHNQDGIEKFDPVDESDAIYHEYGHVVQHAMVPGVLTMQAGQNRDMDTLLEALADVFSSAKLRDDNILTYLASNSRFFLANIGPSAIRGDRTGTTHVRTTSNALFFPDGYVGEAHLDGRVISGAFADFRRYLVGQSVTLLSQCSGACTTQIPGSQALLHSDDAYDKALELFYSPLQQMQISQSSTLFSYALRVKENCNNTALFPWCVPFAEGLSSILKGRGLISAFAEVPMAEQQQFSHNGKAIPGVISFGNDPVTNSVLVDPATGWVPVPGLPTLANSDAVISPCEMIAIFPKVTNNSQNVYHGGLAANGAINAALFDSEIELISFDGFQPVSLKDSSGQSVVIDPITADDPQGPFPTKIWGFLMPGENSTSLISSTDSRWYKKIGASSFSQPLSNTFFPIPMAFLVKAPSQPGAIAKARFRINTRVYNSQFMIPMSNDNPVNDVADAIETSLTVSSTSGISFCK